MKDVDFLKWLHARLIGVHGESTNSDYMNKLRCIIDNTDKEQQTPNIVRPFDPEKFYIE